MAEVCTYEFFIRETENASTKCDAIWVRGNDGSPISIDKAWIRTSSGQPMQIFPWCEEEDPPCPNPPCAGSDFETWNNADISGGNEDSEGGILNP